MAMASGMFVKGRGAFCLMLILGTIGLTACKKAPADNSTGNLASGGNVSGPQEKLHVLNMQADSSDSHGVAANVVAEFSQEFQRQTAATNIAIQRAASQPKLQSDDAAGLDASIAAKNTVLHVLQEQVAFTQGWQARLDEIIKAQGRPGLEYDPAILDFKNSFGRNQPLLLELYTATQKFYSTDLDVLVVLKGNFDHRHQVPGGKLIFDDPVVQKKFDEMVIVNQQAAASLAQIKAKIAGMQKQSQ